MEIINLYLTRKKNTALSCIGELKGDVLLRDYATLEDPVRDKKIQKVTAFQEGVYRLRLRTVLSPKTQDYQNKYDWFTWHIELQNVPNYKHCYLHVGNVPKDSDGCVLVGLTSGEDRINSSRIAFKEFYLSLLPNLEKENEYEVYLHVENCFENDN